MIGAILMGASALAGVASSAIGAGAAAKREKAAAQNKAIELKQQKEFQDTQLLVAGHARKQQAEENEYRRIMEGFNREIMQKERQFELTELNELKRNKEQERAYEIERQLAHDRDRAKQREFEIGQLLQNQQLSAEERKAAMDELKKVQAIAGGERDEDMRRFLTEVEGKKDERDFMVQEYQKAQAQSRKERDSDLAHRAGIMGSIEQMRQSLAATSAGLGLVPDMPQFTEADLAGEIARRKGDYLGYVDRAADRVASVNEGDLMRRGMDESTQGISRRGDIAERLSEQYRKADQQAYDDAVKYMTGQSDFLSDNIFDVMKRREGILGETEGVTGAGINSMLGLPAVSSAYDATRFANLVPTSVYNRGVLSAGDYTNPLTVDSAIYDNRTVGGQLSQFLRPTTATTQQGFGIQSAVMAPYTMKYENPYQYTNSAAGMQQKRLGMADDDFRRAQANMGAANQDFGRSIASAIPAAGGAIGAMMGGGGIPGQDVAGPFSTSGPSPRTGWMLSDEGRGL